MILIQKYANVDKITEVIRNIFLEAQKKLNLDLINFASIILIYYYSFSFFSSTSYCYLFYKLIQPNYRRV